MCHLLLLLPILALPMFWFWPVSIAVPVHSAATGASLALDLFALKAMRRPVLTGRERMVGATGRVASAADGHLTVAIDAELWTATSDIPFAVGDEVRVVGMDGLELRVEGLS